VAAPLFVKSAVIGFSIAAPVGPIGVLCIRRTLADGRAAGFASGLGAAVADSLYGLVGALGLTAISKVLVGQQTPLRIVGGGSRNALLNQFVADYGPFGTVTCSFV
jgi:threonine/homoserine/homoserine lactone efflux protein